MKTIVVGLDGSPGGHRALRWAIDEARRWDARLRVASAWTFPAMAVSAPLGMLPSHAEMHEAQKILVSNVLEDEGVDQIDDLDIEVDIYEGGAAKSLVEASKDADLLVVGARGLGGFRELILGSVSHHCALHARCPVVIVHATDIEHPEN